jgi:hypothetical protein
VILNDELKRIQREQSWPTFKILPQNLSRGTEESCGLIQVSKQRPSKYEAEMLIVNSLH